MKASTIHLIIGLALLLLAIGTNIVGDPTRALVWAILWLGFVYDYNAPRHTKVEGPTSIQDQL